MTDLSVMVAGCILASLIVYTLLGGADFGGGVWDLMGSGPRAQEQKRMVARAMGPVWETNHIWIIIAVVILFTAFPQAFALASVALFVPITLMLVGIVLRGWAFAFHSYHLHEEGSRSRWGTLFSVASLLTPVLLGAIIGAISSGGIRSHSPIGVGSSRVWLAPFPLSVGILTLALYSHLAAVYLIFETSDPDLREDFRVRSLGSSVVVAVLLVIVPLLAKEGGPDFYLSLMGSEWSWGLVFFTATAALGAHVALLLRNYPLARLCAAAQAALVLAGWGAAQYPFIVRPDLTIPATVSPPATLRLILIALGAGVLFLFPAVFFLFRIFKKDVLSGRSLKS